MLPTEREKGLPKLTGLQFLVLSSVAGGGEISGRDMRRWLADFGVKSTGPQYYQLMARLEEAGYVQGWYAQVEIANQVVNERRYRITPKGEAAWEDTKAFYFAFNRGQASPEAAAV